MPSPARSTGHDGQLLTGQLAVGRRHGSLYIHIDQGADCGGLVAHQSGDLADEPPELLHAGILTAEDGQLVLDQGGPKT